jgi:glutathione S-transferase
MSSSESFSHLKPITIWGRGGPNPPKVAILLEELGVPYEAIAVPISDVKKPEYLTINPNGRLPAIRDPNNGGLTLWESGAILEYLIERYDTPSHRFSFPAGSREAFLAKQYLFFQVSGQGPYYGQAAWFKKFHSEPLPSAVARYVGEVNRVTAVLEKVLAEEAEKYPGAEDGPWLVGGKYSFADIAFISWQNVILKIVGSDEYDPGQYPRVKQWLEKLLERPAVQAGLNQGGKLT